MFGKIAVTVTLIACVTVPALARAPHVSPDECLASSAQVRATYGQQAWTTYSRRIPGHEGRCYYLDLAKSPASVRAKFYQVRKTAIGAISPDMSPPRPPVLIKAALSSIMPAKKVVTPEVVVPAHRLISRFDEEILHANIIDAEDLATFNGFHAYGVILTWLPAWRDDIFICASHGAPDDARGIHWPLMH